MNIKKISLVSLLCLAVFSTSVIGAKQPADSEFRKTWAWWWGSWYGTELVSEENEQFVRSIQQDMGMANWHITILQFNSWHINLSGPDNACAVGLGVNRIYINQETFNKLPLTEKKELIRHELAHLKKRHHVKRWLFTTGIGILAYLVITSLAQKIAGDAKKEYDFPFVKVTIDPVAIAKNLMISATALILRLPFSRSCEREADYIAAQDFEAARGGVSSYTKKINKNIRPCWLSSWFSSHPIDEERLAFYKKAVAKHKKLRAAAAA